MARVREQQYRAPRTADPDPGSARQGNEVHLNFFSFSKLLIYKDLDAETWPEGSQPADHPLVQQLFGSDGFAQAPPDIGEDEHIDDAEGVAGLHPVMDADSSQTLAVLDAIKGRNLVIQGPPGTGKSQTITNLIGEALACGRTILFVAEKMAALEVVKRRLDTVHLGDACLELQQSQDQRRRDGDIPSSLRNPSRIASEEIETALVHAVRVSYGMKPADAAGEAIRLFGFRRSGPKIVKRFRQVLNDLVAQGAILREGSLLRVPDDARAGSPSLPG